MVAAWDQGCLTDIKSKQHSLDWVNAIILMIGAGVT